MSRPARVLITGFGRFPGAPVNPTAALVEKLARVRRPALADACITKHVFATSYAAVDADLPALIARARPDALLMFGVASTAKTLRIELLARNRASLLFPDAGGAKPSRAAIAPGGPAWRRGRFSLARVLAAARAAGARVALSRNAGAYLCNYACWRALEQADAPDSPRVVLFVHIPRARRRGPARRSSALPSQAAILQAATAILRATLASARCAARAGL